jgi:hypothetical protein
VKHLFPNFLTSGLEYNICKSYWETKIEYLFTKNNIGKWKPYLNTKWANGQEQLNGNPIVNYYLSVKNKALRIIQEEPETDTLIFSAWTGKIQTDDLDADEMVISLEFTPEAERVAFDLIEKWIIDDYSPGLMEKYIDFVFESSKQLKSNSFHVFI